MILLAHVKIFSYLCTVKFEKARKLGFTLTDFQY